MTEKDLKRIQSAYESGLDIEIWFDGRWYKFDAREYPNGGFSTTRQYRIVGSAYADIAEKRIADLEAYNEKLLNGDIEKHNKIVELKAQIEKMKCCFNCKHSRTEYEHCKTDKHEKWELKEEELENEND